MTIYNGLYQGFFMIVYQVINDFFLFLNQNICCGYS